MRPSTLLGSGTTSLSISAHDALPAEFLFSSGGSWLLSSLYANYDDSSLPDPSYLAQNVWNISQNLIVPGPCRLSSQ